MIGWLLRLGQAAPVVLEADHGASSLSLRPPARADYAGWLDATRSAEVTLRCWQPRWPDDHLTERAYRRRLALFDAERAAGAGHAFHLWSDAATGGEARIEGAIRLSPVRGGARGAGTLGYWIADRAAGRGLATAAVEAVTAYAFERLGIARVEASHVAANAASGRVLAKAGFAREGLARAYVEIDGVRLDHVLTARLNPALNEPDRPSDAPAPQDASAARLAL